MALPNIITTDYSQGTNKPRSAVYKASDDELYFIHISEADRKDCTLRKATDPDSITTWSLADTVQPDATLALNGISDFLDGQDLSVVAYNDQGGGNQGNVWYFRGRLTNDSADDQRASTALPSLGSPDVGTCGEALVVVASDGDIYVFAQATTDSDMGTSYSRCDYSKSTNGGANWSAWTRVDDLAKTAGTAINDVMAAINDVSGHANVDYVYMLFTGGHKGLSTSDSLSSLQTFSGGNPTIYTNVPIFVDRGTDKMIWAVEHSGGTILLFNLGASLTGETSETHGRNPANSISADQIWDDAADEVYVFFTDQSNHDLYFEKDDGAYDWAGSATVEKTLSFSGADISINHFDRGNGNVIGYTYQTASGTIRYDEKDVAVAPDITAVSTLPAITQLATIAHEAEGAGSSLLAAVTQQGGAIERAIAAAVQILGAIKQQAEATAGDPPTGDGDQLLPAIQQTGSLAEILIAAGVTTLSPVTQLGALLEKILPSGVQTLPPVLQDGSAIMQPAATGSSALAAINQLGALLEIILPLGVSTLPPVSQSGGGLMHPDIAASNLLAAITQQGAITQAEFVIAASSILSPITQTGVAIMQPEGAGASALAAISQLGALLEIILPAGIQTLPPVGQSGSLILQPDGAGVSTLAAIEQVGALLEIISAAAIQTLGAVTQQGAIEAGQDPSGTGVSILGSITQVAAILQTFIGVGASNLPSILQAAVVQEILAGAGVQTMGPISQLASGAEAMKVAGVTILAAITQQANGLLTAEAAAIQILAAVRQSGAAVMFPSSVGVSQLAAILQTGIGIGIIGDSLLRRLDTLIGEKQTSSLIGEKPTTDIIGEL